MLALFLDIRKRIDGPMPERKLGKRGFITIKLLLGQHRH